MLNYREKTAIFKRSAELAMSIFVLSALSCLIPLQEAMPPTYDHPSAGPWEILSEAHVMGLNLTQEDLKRVQVFLGSRLILKSEWVNSANEVHELHGLHVDKTNYVETLDFPRDTPGRIIRFTEIGGFLSKKVVRLQVAFEVGGREFLEFIPDENGQYKLAAGSTPMRYGDRRYTCIEGCPDNFLWISADILEGWRERSRVIEGWPFE